MPDKRDKIETQLPFKHRDIGDEDKLEIGQRKRQGRGQRKCDPRLNKNLKSIFSFRKRENG